MRVKICGVKRIEDAQAAGRLGANALGLNFAPESPRYIGGIAAARQLIDAAQAPSTLQWAGVFVNPPLESVCECVERLGLSIVQLHGEETPDDVANVRRKLPAGVALWKAVRVASVADLNALDRYVCDAWVLDSKVAGVRGGSGQRFDWSILKDIPRTRPIVLSGGLTPDNVAESIRTVKPDWVDTASGVELAPGVKDESKMSAFIRAMLK